MNRVHKIIYRDNEITFIIQAEGETNFFWWSFTRDELRPYFEKHGAIGNMASNNLMQDQADAFVNSPDANEIGIGGGYYNSLDEVLEKVGDS